MITLQTFLLGLLIVSTLSGLVTEALKKVLTENGKTYKANTLAGLASLVLSVAIGFGYMVLKNIDFTSSAVVYLVALVFASWLSAMVGYDKIVQAITQFKTSSDSNKE